MTPRLAALVAAAFPEGLPDRLRAGFDPVLVDRLLYDYKWDPVMPFGHTGPVRASTADRGAPERWAAWVREAWPHPDLDGFLALAPPGTRRMVDSDGGPTAVVYLDDLQDVAHGLDGPAGLPLLCATLTLPSGARGWLTRHAAPPLDVVSGPLRARVAELVAAGAGDLWGVRWSGGRPVGALWVTEARWRGDPDRASAVVEVLGHPPGWAAIRAASASVGLVAYPDGVELRAEGGADVTVGFVGA